MGLFSRNKTNKSIHSGERTPSLQSESIKSPQSARIPTSSFGSLPTVAMPKPPDPNVDPAAYLRSIFAVRERTKFVTNKAQRNKLNHFDVDMSKWSETAQYVVSIVKVRPAEFGLCRDSLIVSVERLRARIPFNPTSWTMATFRSWRSAQSRSIAGHVDFTD